MIRIGDRAKIVISPSLIEMQLIPLASRWGTIMSIKRNKKNPGAWVALDKAYKNSLCWFIPIQSIRTPMNEDVVEKKKRMNLLNKTIL